MKTFALTAALLALTAPAFAAAPTSATAYKGRELARQATIPLAKARTIALSARPGKITAEELEKEAGGSGLRYSFDVAQGGKSYEVGVDAMTGKVPENAAETAAQEKAEQRAERRDKKAPR